MNICSMTGFARVRKVHAHGEAIASVKSVNHRGLDMHFHMAPELDPFENALRCAVKRHVNRGHLQIQVRYLSTESSAPAIVNQALLDAYIEAYRRLASLHRLPGEPDLNAALGIAGMFQPSDAELDEALEAVLVGALDEALENLNRFREREGAEIAAEMLERNRMVQSCVSDMEQIRAKALPEFAARLSDRLADLLKGVALEPQRLAQEAAFLADRSDISEELSRLKIHTAQLSDLLNKGGEVGKKLDFLLQEMQRETNTSLAKSAGIGELGLPLTALGLQVKAEIEKIREQALNLE